MDGIPSKELANMIAHGDHLTIVAHGTPAERRMILDAADEPLVRAVERILKTQGLTRRPCSDAPTHDSDRPHGFQGICQRQGS